MPMLTTLRMRLPVWPFHSPERTRSAKAAILSSTAWTSGTTSSPSTMICSDFGARECDVQDGAVLGDVDLLAGEHGLGALRAGRTLWPAATSSFRVSSVTRFLE